MMDKQPRGGFAATLKGDRARGFDYDREMHDLTYYSMRLMARLDPAYRVKLTNHMAARDAFRNQWRGAY